MAEHEPWWQYVSPHGSTWTPMAVPEADGRTWAPWQSLWGLTHQVLCLVLLPRLFCCCCPLGPQNSTTSSATEVLLVVLTRMPSAFVFYTKEKCLVGCCSIHHPSFCCKWVKAAHTTVGGHSWLATRFQECPLPPPTSALRIASLPSSHNTKKLHPFCLRQTWLAINHLLQQILYNQKNSLHLQKLFSSLQFSGL